MKAQQSSLRWNSPFTFIIGIRLRLGVSRSHSVKDKSIVLKGNLFRILNGQYNPKSPLRASPLHADRLNKPFARSGHMVRNKLCWDANNAVGLPKLNSLPVQSDVSLFATLRYLRPSIA